MTIFSVGSTIALSTHGGVVMAEKKIKKIVLAYSGGLDTSIIIPWLKENYDNPEIIAVSGDVGQGTELDGLEEKALKTGASKLYVLDLKEEFIQDYVYETLKAGAKYEGEYLLGTAFARPIIAKAIVDIAKKEGRHLPRLYRKGQRSGAFRVDHQGVRAGDEDHRAVARMEHQIARRGDRIRGSAQRALEDQPRNQLQQR